jgi:hypothetical protein
MGDWAGAFSYIADRPVVQTEGLVNAPEYCSPFLVTA